MKHFIMKSGFWSFTLFGLFTLLFFQNCGKVNFSEQAPQQPLESIGNCGLERVNLSYSATTFTSTPGVVTISIVPINPSSFNLSEYSLTIDTPTTAVSPLASATFEIEYNAPQNTNTNYTSLITLNKIGEGCSREYVLNVRFNLAPPATCEVVLSGPNTAVIGVANNFSISTVSCPGITNVGWDQNYNDSTFTPTINTGAGLVTPIVFTKAGNFNVISGSQFSGLSNVVLSNQLAVAVSCPSGSTANTNNDCVCNSTGAITTTGTCPAAVQCSHVVFNENNIPVTLTAAAGNQITIHGRTAPAGRCGVRCLTTVGTCQANGQFSFSQALEPGVPYYNSLMACEGDCSSNVCGTLDRKATKVFPDVSNPVPVLCATGYILATPPQVPAAAATDREISWQCKVDPTSAPINCSAQFCSAAEFIVNGTTCQACPAGTFPNPSGDACLPNPSNGDFVEIIRSKPCNVLDTSILSNMTTVSETPSIVFEQQFSLALQPASVNTTWCSFVRVPQNYNPNNLTVCTQELTGETDLSPATDCRTTRQVPAPYAEFNYTENNRAKKILAFKSGFGHPSAYFQFEKAGQLYRTILKYNSATTSALHRLVCPTGQVPVNDGTACGPR